jgi:DnaJ-like protein
MPDTVDNPLIHPIRRLLSEQGRSFSEHELIKSLQAEEAFPGLAESARLALFQTHFLVMNALYRLQEQLAAEHIHLHISPLAICLQSACEENEGALVELGSQAALKKYYCDWSHFQSTDEQSVDGLLSGFWQHYLARDKQAEAYQALLLEPGSGWGLIKKAYRRMAAECHPDRGGDAAEFMRVREAYEVLVRTVGPDSR